MKHWKTFNAYVWGKTSLRAVNVGESWIENCTNIYPKQSNFIGCHDFQSIFLLALLSPCWSFVYFGDPCRLPYCSEYASCPFERFQCWTFEGFSPWISSSQRSWWSCTISLSEWLHQREPSRPSRMATITLCCHEWRCNVDTRFIESTSQSECKN